MGQYCTVTVCGGVHTLVLDRYGFCTSRMQNMRRWAIAACLLSAPNLPSLCPPRRWHHSFSFVLSVRLIWTLPNQRKTRSHATGCVLAAHWLVGERVPAQFDFD